MDENNIFKRNGVRILDAKTVTCRECGESLKTIEESHLQGSKCTGRLPNRAAYRRAYPKAPVVTAEAYERMTRNSLK